MGVPDSAGVLADLTAHTRQVAYNDPEALESLLAEQTDVAALIIEPVLGNIGPVLPENTYLKDIREMTRAHDVLLIFDEVITGYRIGIGGSNVVWGKTRSHNTGKNYWRGTSHRRLRGTT